MSYTFSRRAFLKYSAATAVAVAGASLLGGCEYQDPQNPVCKTLPGAIKSDLQVIAGLKSMKIEKGTCTLEVDIESARANPIRLTTDCFSIAHSGRQGPPDPTEKAHHHPSGRRPLPHSGRRSDRGVQVYAYPREPRVFHDLGDHQGSVRRVHRKSEHQQELSVS